jgi:hypothetical protein
MRTFEVTSPGLRKDGKEIAVGAKIRADEMVPTMVGKVKEVSEPESRLLEVATPQRGRPPKEK